MPDPREIFEDTSRYKYLLDKIEIDDKTSKSIPSTIEDVEFPESEDDIFHITNFSDLMNIENLAHKYYGEARLWWVIVIANNIIDLFDTDEVGLTLRIPAPNMVKKVLDNELNNRIKNESQ